MVNKNDASSKQPSMKFLKNSKWRHRRRSENDKNRQTSWLV